MGKWSDWVEIELAKSSSGPFDNFGIYQIRAVAPSNEPIPICRLVGIDSLGILYVGRSGYRYQRSKRTIANRIREFVRQQHSGGITYASARKVLQQSPKFSQHRLQVRAMFLPDDKIGKAESSVLNDYFSIYAELPPCNSSLPTGIKTR